MRPTTLSIAVVFAGMLCFVAPAGRAFAADDAPPPLPPPPEATTDKPAAAKPAAKPGPAATTKADAPATGDLPSMAQMQALFDAGNYNDLLKAFAKVLPLKGKAAEPYD